MRRVTLLQEAVVLDPYARSIVGRQNYGQLAQVSIPVALTIVLLAGLHIAICLLRAQISQNKAADFSSCHAYVAASQACVSPHSCPY